MKTLAGIIVLVMAICLYLITCKDNQETDIETSIRSMIGRDFVIDDLSRSVLGNEIESKDYYLVTYMDSSICNSCRIRAWHEYVNEAMAMSNCELGNVIILSPEVDFKENIDVLNSLEGLNYIIDKERFLFNKNGISKDDRLSFFLLDKNFRIVCTGNPITNPKVRELFFSYFSNYRSFSDVPYTKAEIAKPVIRQDELLVDSLVRLAFCVKNIGGKELLIRNVTPSCSCISARAERLKVLPGDSAKISIAYRPTHAGRVIERIYLSYNGGDSPIALVVKGQARLAGEPTFRENINKFGTQ